MFYQQLKERFLALAEERGLLADRVSVASRILNNQEAIGNPTRQDYPLLKGKEFLMEASFHDCRGQAFTDAPCEKSSRLADIIELPLDSIGNRALFIAALNAVMRYLNQDILTIHCHDDEPEECAAEIVRRVQARGCARVGLVGLQPAMLEALAGALGPEKVFCVDRDENQRGSSKFGVPIMWGDEKETADLFAQSDLVLATGSTVVNGSLPGLLELATRFDTEIYFYGTSIAGAADLMGLKRFCFEAA